MMEYRPWSSVCVCVCVCVCVRLCQYHTASIMTSNWPMALQISPSHWAHLCCLDCRRTSSFPEETHLRMQRRARRVHTSWHNIYAARMHTHARRRALARSLFTSSLKCFVCLVTDWCVYFWCCGERKTRQNGRRRGTGEASRHTHTHTHTLVACFLPKLLNEVFLFH